MYPDDRVLVAVMNNRRDWQIVLTEHWYRIPTKKAPTPVPHLDWLAFYFTAAFGNDRHAVHYFAPVLGHELVTRVELFPHEPEHARAGQWYFKLMLGDIRHKLPPITSRNWRRVTFIFTTGDRFERAVDLRDLLADVSPEGVPFVTLKDAPAVYEIE